MTDTPTPIETIEDIDSVLRILNDFYDSPGAAVLWITSPQRLLDDRAPLDLIKAGRVGIVMELLDAMEDGVYI